MFFIHIQIYNAHFVNNLTNKIKILISPLDWGLGHATRCVPLLKRLQECGHSIIIASSNHAKALLQKEFPDFYFTELPGYNITYSKHKRLLPVKILLQLPKIFFLVKKEKKILENLVEKHNIDLVISDNRFGLYTNKVPCVFITHQLHIKASSSWMEKIIRRLNYHFINKFTECWIPDLETAPNLSGELSHPEKMPSVPVIYIGPLSRFTETGTGKIKYAAAIILSGPEPQRSLLEEKLLHVLAKRTDEKFLLIRGLPGHTEILSATDNISVYNHLSTAEMQDAVEECEYIISRSGYTTIMEMLSLKKKTILIPTPGQTEQEYLASCLMQQQWAFCCSQDDDFETQYILAKKFTYRLPSFSQIQTGEIIEDRISKLLSGVKP